MTPSDPMATSGVPPVSSLLWPGAAPGAPPARRTAHLEPAALEDLGIEDVAAAAPRRHIASIVAVLSNPPIDAETITYRQEIVADLIAAPNLVSALDALLPRLVDLGRLTAPEWRDQTPLHQVIWRLGQLELMVDCVQALSEALGRGEVHLRSHGFATLRDQIAAIQADTTFAHMVGELPRLRAEADRVGSVTIGVNLDHLLRPVGATLLSINSERFEGESLLARLLGRRDLTRGQAQVVHGIGPLHTMPDRVPGLTDKPHPLMHPLFRDLSDTLASTARSIADALGRYSRLQGVVLANLAPEFAFYLSAVGLVERLRAAGLPTCRPQLAPADERVSRFEGLYNPLLALRCLEPSRRREGSPERIIPNDAALGPAGRVVILTGPNRGGKTTFTQAVGLAHILAQSGIPVPAASATLSPVDGIYTHFPAAERLDLETGRLGEEAARLAGIFQRATPYSLVLLNESLASTSPGESLYLARDVVRALRLLGARAIYATHLHDLATDLDAINAGVPGDSPVVSLVAHAEPVPGGGEGAVRPTFRITPGPPLGTSYARQIAAYYGISYEKLAAALSLRLDNSEDERGGS